MIMKLEDLGRTLSKMYNEAPKGEAVAMVHLFGIIYAEQIKTNRFSTKEIAIEAEISVAYGTEISKGVKLAKYVKPIL